MNLGIEILRDLKSSPLRSLLSALSVFMTVAAVVTIVAASGIAREVFVAQEEQLNGRAVTLSATLPAAATSPQDVATLVGELNERIAGQGGAFAVISSLSATMGSVQSSTLGDGEPANIFAVAGDLRGVKRLPMVQGRWLRADGQAFPLELVTNEAGLADTGPVGADVGLRLTPQDSSVVARVVGVVSDGVQDPQYYLSMSAALAADPALLDVSGGMTTLVHRAATSQGSLELMTRRALGDSGVDLTQVDITRSDHVADLSKRLSDLRRGFLIAAAVSMVVALLGLLNIGLASVRERSRELVVRRAIGATRGRLFLLVLSVALTLALLACAVALVLTAVAVYAVLPRYLPSDSAIVAPGFPWAGAVAGLVAAIAVAAIGAGYPAVVAARLDVASALRD